jgi:hypothetical protein
MSIETETHMYLLGFPAAHVVAQMSLVGPDDLG